MTQTNTSINIQVTLTPDGSSPSGYQFSYASTEPCVSSNGTVDLSDNNNDDVELVYTLMPISGGGQPAFSSTASDAVWFEEWHRDAPDPAPCPDGPGHASNTFKNLSVQNGNTLQFTDKNKDSKRYAYALRCMVGSNLVVDDPVIVNK